MAEKFKCFIFDLDGTLTDTVDDLAAAFNHMRRKFGFPEITRQEMIGLIGNGMYEVIRKSYVNMQINAPAEEIERALKTMLDYYLEHTVELTVPYPGVRETLERLRQKNCRLAVVTNKFTAAALNVLQTLELSDYFDHVFGNGEGFPLKPAPDLLLLAAERCGVAASDCVMVGDNYTDLGAGRNAGCKSIFCNYGYGVELNEKADFYIDNFSELKVYAQ